MGKFTEKLKILKATKGIRGINYARINQYIVAAVNESGENRTFKTSGNYEYIHNFMDELRDQGFDNVAIICEY